MVEMKCKACNATSHESMLTEENFEIWETKKGKRLAFICPDCEKPTLTKFETLEILGYDEKKIKRVNKINDPDAVDESTLKSVMADDLRKKTAKAVTASNISRIASLTTEIVNQSADRIADALKIGHEITQRWGRNALIAEQDLAVYLNNAVTFYETYKGGGLEKALEAEKKARQEAEMKAEYWKRAFEILAEKARPNVLKLAALENYFTLALLDGEEIDVEKLKKIMEAI